MANVYKTDAPAAVGEWLIFEVDRSLNRAEKPVSVPAGAMLESGTPLKLDPAAGVFVKYTGGALAAGEHPAFLISPLKNDGDAPAVFDGAILDRGPVTISMAGLKWEAGTTEEDKNAFLLAFADKKPVSYK